MKPKKLLLALIATAALLGVTIPVTTAEAGSYRSRVEGTCGYCNQAVYSYYQPLGYDYYGRSSYSWVTSHHTACRSNYRGNNYGYARSMPSVGFSINLGTPSYYGGYRGYNGYRGYSGYSGYGGGYRSYRSHGHHHHYHGGHRSHGRGGHRH